MKHSLYQQHKLLYSLKQCIDDKISSFAFNLLTYFHPKLFDPISKLNQLKANIFRITTWLSVIASSLC